MPVDEPVDEPGDVGEGDPEADPVNVAAGDAVARAPTPPEAKPLSGICLDGGSVKSCQPFPLRRGTYGYFIATNGHSSSLERVERIGTACRSIDGAVEINT